MSFEYIQKHYGVPAEYGRRVIADGEPGVIVGCCGQYVEVNLDKHKRTVTANYHPTWNMQYLEMGTVRKLTAGQRRYQEFLDADWFDGNFAQWLGVDKETKARREFYKKYGY